MPYIDVLGVYNMVYMMIQGEYVFKNTYSIGNIYVYICARI